ncbi:hypothetical protein [Embleya sp. NPDC005575]|uniref:hypothetical protein n=1 Tax=Embleya sp. NPDC005575 TaxID=3156892 RepID=UPI0033ACC887
MPRPQARPNPAPRRWSALALIALAQFMVIMAREVGDAAALTDGFSAAFLGAAAIAAAGALIAAVTLRKPTAAPTAPAATPATTSVDRPSESLPTT